MIPEELWERSRPHLEAAMARGDKLPLDVVRGALERHDAHLWPGERSAAVCEPVKAYHVWLAGGDLRELLAMEQRASAWAQAHGFDRMTIVGRPGWARALPGYAYETALVKRL